MASTTSSLYEVLGISTSASGHEIKAAYRKLARTRHPDVVAFEQKEVSANEFMKIHAAYSTLSDPHKRANYDRDLFNQSRPFGHSATAAAAASAMAGFSYSSCRSWETDQCWQLKSVILFPCFHYGHSHYKTEQKKQGSQEMDHKK